MTVAVRTLSTPSNSAKTNQRSNKGIREAARAHPTEFVGHDKSSGRPCRRDRPRRRSTPQVPVPFNELGLYQASSQSTELLILCIGISSRTLRLVFETCRFK